MPIFDLHNACNPVLLTPGAELSPVLLDRTNYNLLAQGGASVLTGASGHLMMQIPKFQYSYSFLGTSHKYQISLLPFAGSQIFPAFIKSGVIVPYRYIGIPPASWYDVSESAYVDGDGVNSGWDNSSDKIGSIYGKKPLTNLTRAKFRNAAARVGAGWLMMDFWLYSLLKILYITKHGDFDSQTVLGQGNSRFSAWSFSTDISASGKVLSITSPGKSTAGGDSQDYANFMGIELFTGIYEFIDGWNINSGANYICSSPENFADDTTSNYLLYGSTNPVTNGWQATLQQNVAMLPATVGGTGNSSVDICDYYYSAISGWVAPFAFGTANNGSSAGLFDLNALSASSVAGGHIGVRLCF